MDNLEAPAPVQPDTHDLQAQCDSLRQLIISVLVLLIIVSGTFTIYLLREYRWANADLAAVEPQYKAEVAQYSRANLVIRDFVERIREYGGTHQDFIPVLNKYGMKPLTAPPVSSPAPKK